MSDVGAALRRLVIERSQNRCEYCRIRIDLDEMPGCVDHIIPLKHHGTSDAENLAWSCFHCNTSKQTDLTGLDPDTGNLTRLFNPRTDVWSQHFDCIEAEIVGCTAIGRTTLYVVNMNAPPRAMLRRVLIASGQLWNP